MFNQNFKIWLKALRLPFLTATLVPVALGSSIAWRDTGRFNWLYFFLTFIGISFLHIGTNLTNDYFDHKTGNDKVNLNPTPFSGGSRVIQDGTIPPALILRGALISLGIGSFLGLYLNRMLSGNIILILGLIGVFCAFFYTASPFRIGYRGLGELVVGLCFGPLVVMGAYYVQTGTFSLAALLASIPIGILIMLVLYINEFPDYNADKSVNKNTLVVILGKERAVTIYHLLLTLVYLYIGVCVLFRVLPYHILIILFTVPMALKTYFISKENFNSVRDLLPANAMTIGLHLSIGLLITTGFILDKIF